MFDIDGKLNIDLLEEYMNPQEYDDVLQLIEEVTGSDEQLYIFMDSRYDETTEEFHYSAVMVDEFHNVRNQIKGKTINNELKQVSDKKLAADLIAVHEAIDWLILNNYQYGAFIIYCENKDILNAVDEQFNYPITSIVGQSLVELFKKTFLFRYVLFVTSDFFIQQAPHIKVSYLKTKATKNLAFEDEILPRYIKDTFYEVLEKKKRLEHNLNRLKEDYDKIKDIEVLNGETFLLSKMFDVYSEDLMNCEIDLDLFKEYYGLTEKEY